MNKKSTGLIVGAVIVIAIILGVVLVSQSSDKKSSPAASSNGSSSQNSSSGSSSSSDAVATNNVEIKDYMFTPMTITVKAGTTVTWTNKDAVKHSVVADTASEDAPNSPLIGQNETYTFTFKKAGTYKVHCMPHPYMQQTITVT